MAVPKRVKTKFSNWFFANIFHIIRVLASEINDLYKMYIDLHQYYCFYSDFQNWAFGFLKI